jgi:hypothetical protein
VFGAPNLVIVATASIRLGKNGENLSKIGSGLIHAFALLALKVS